MFVYLSFADSPLCMCLSASLSLSLFVYVCVSRTVEARKGVCHHRSEQNCGRSEPSRGRRTPRGTRGRAKFLRKEAKWDRDTERKAGTERLRKREERETVTYIHSKVSPCNLHFDGSGKVDQRRENTIALIIRGSEKRYIKREEEGSDQGGEMEMRASYGFIASILHGLGRGSI